MTANPKACVIMIGNELLSGRTQDKNLSMIAAKLNQVGISVATAQVIADDEKIIAEVVNHARAHYDYVFTSGGIGPTHDDITTASIAKAFGVKVMRHPEAQRRLLAHYRPEDVNEARMKMADIPEGAALVDNPISAAPGFRIENVLVLAGVPSICSAMMDFITPTLQGGAPILSTSIQVQRPEGDIAHGVTQIDAAHTEVQIGIYPLMQHGMLRSTIVLRHENEQSLNDAVNAMCHWLDEFGADYSVLEDE